MPRSKDTKVWNEDLYAGLSARSDQARSQGKQSQYTWRDGALAIQAVRQDIYTFTNGRIVGLPSKLSKTVENEVRAIIQGDRPLFPEGWKNTNRHQRAKNPQVRVDYKKDPYLKIIKMRGGSFAILLAFHYSDTDTMTKEQICVAAQEFCDEAMEPNIYAGRPRGAFSAKNTLVKHQLLLQNTSRQRGGGGCWTYTITENGRHFTKAMMEKFHLKDDGLGQKTPTNSTNMKASPPVATFFSPTTAKAEKQGSKFKQSPGTPSPTKAARSRTVEHKNLDKDELLDWLEMADVDEQKKFKVGESRRASLHDLCTVITRKLPGLRLSHTSEGVGNDRALYITVLERDSTVYGIEGALRSSVMVSPGSPASVSEATTFARDAIRRDDDASPKKKLCTTRAKREGVAPQGARRALYSWESDDDSEFEIDCKPRLTQKEKSQPSMKHPTANISKREVNIEDSDSDSDDSEFDTLLPIARKPQAPTKLEPSTNAKRGLYFDESDEDNHEEDRKPPPLPPVQKFVVDLLSDSDSDDDEEEDFKQLLQKKKIPNAPKALDEQNGNLPLLSKGSLDEPVCLDDSQDSFLSYNLEANSVKEAESGRVPLPEKRLNMDAPKPKLIIIIDSRERDRNATPRQLRMELTRLLASGLLHRVWPTRMPEAEVVERTLANGDFAFEIEKNPVVQQKLALSIERKRVSDLVQRSAKGDHWNQLQRMCNRFEYAALLIEGDTTTANQYVADNSQHLDAWDPDSFLIDDDKSIFRFIGRAILSSRKMRFIQTKDEQASLRAVGAFGLVASLSTLSSRVKETTLPPASKAEHNVLSDRLLNGGIPWTLAKRISCEVGSCSRMDELYESACTSARDTLLCPIIAHSLPLSDFPNSVTNATGWSKAIRRVWFTSLADPKEARTDFDKQKGRVSDPGRLLAFLHSGFSLETSLEMIQNNLGYADAPARTVQVELSPQLRHCFPAMPGGEQACFYSVKTPATTNPLNLEVPTIVLRTEAGQLCSSRLCLHVFEGPVVVDAVELAMAKHLSDHVSAAWEAARCIHMKCSSSTMHPGKDRRILLVRGLSAAIERSAKQAGYRQELLVVVDMTLAAVSICHDMVVIQAVRKKVEDLEMVVQNVALACFHHQLLTDEI